MVVVVVVVAAVVFIPTFFLTYMHMIGWVGGLMGG